MKLCNDCEYFAYLLINIIDKDNNCIAICEKYDKTTGFWTNKELETLSCVEYKKEGVS